MDIRLFVRDQELMPIQEPTIPAVLTVCRATGARAHVDRQNRTLHINSVVGGKVIVLDPGHGGLDRGGAGTQGHVEAQETLDIALRLRAFLESAGATVILTRDTDLTVSAGERVKIANKARPTLILSIHASGREPANTQGVMAYYSYVPLFRSRRLAQSLCKRVVLATGLPDAGVRLRLSDPENEDYFRLLAGTWAPSAVVECGHHGHTPDQQSLLTSDFRQRCAEGLYHGIVSYFRSVARAKSRERAGIVTGDLVTVLDELPVPVEFGPSANQKMPVVGQQAPAPSEVPHESPPSKSPKSGSAVQRAPATQPKARMYKESPGDLGDEAYGGNGKYGEYNDELPVPVEFGPSANQKMPVVGQQAPAPSGVPHESPPSSPKSGSAVQRAPATQPKARIYEEYPGDQGYEAYGGYGKYGEYNWYIPPGATSVHAFRPWTGDSYVVPGYPLPASSQPVDLEGQFWQSGSAQGGVPGNVRMQQNVQSRKPFG